MILTPTETSPFSLVQERLRNAPWRLLAVCILLNQTRSTEALPVLEAIFGLFPTADDLAKADEPTLAMLMARLGLQNRRARSLIRMSKAWSDAALACVGGRPSAAIVEAMPGIGAYAADSYRIFVLGQIRDEDPTSGDAKLAAYCDWARTGKVGPWKAKKLPRSRSTPVEEPILVEGDPELLTKWFEDLQRKGEVDMGLVKTKIEGKERS